MIPARLLLLTGGPATGKTWLARRLATHYGACCCSKDEIKERLFDTLGAGDAQWSRRLSDASFAVLFCYAPRLLATQRLLLLEANFRPGEHEALLMAQLSGRSVALAQILCRTDASIRAARLAARAADASRHPGHRDHALDAAALADPGFLDVPGPRWVFHSEAPGESESESESEGKGEGRVDHEFLSLCARVDAWHKQ